ncbi:SusC/RagA family TonB-linked outer membrane protein [Puteibacter caeruleilacunae]|nr:SusC/RagA family TonB-linked outer membrane protein [Puteibacter caeruleilacunae]
MKKNFDDSGLRWRHCKFLRVMKITLFLCLLSIMQVVAGTTMGQNTKLNFKMKNSSIEEVLKNLEKNSTYRFFYESKDLIGKEAVDVDMSKTTVTEVLDAILPDLDLSYEVFDNYIAIKSMVRTSGNTKAMNQPKKISGKVTDEAGEPMPGVSVVVKGTTIGITTDFDGNFTLDLPATAKVVVFSFVGMKSQEVVIDGQSTINVSMREDAIGLEEVVAVGYGTMKKAVVSGAVASVKSDELEKVSAAHVSTTLVGKVGGLVTRQKDSRPGRSTDMEIRGMGKPLYVIDGTPKDGGQFNNIDPNDIESISILKDASAAIYGLRAANGVIIVTTKRGKRNQPNEFNVQYAKTWQNWTRFPKAVDAGDYMELLVEDRINRYGETDITPEELAKWKAGTEPGYESFNWYDYAVQEWAPQEHLNINTSGGSEKINYYISFSHFNQDALFKEFNFNRSNIQSNIEAILADNLTIGMQINGRIETLENPGLPASDDYKFPLLALYSNIPTQHPYANDNPDYIADNGRRTIYNFAYMNTETSGMYKKVWKVLHGNMNLKYKFPIKGLTGKILGSYYYAQCHENNQENRYDAYSYNPVEDTYTRTAGNDNPYKRKIIKNVEEKMFQAQLNFDNKFGNHGIVASLAFEANERIEPYFSINTYPTSDYITLMTTEEFQKLGNSYKESSEMGLAGRVNYTYNDKYTVEFLGRYDGTYVYAPGKRWGFFPGVTGSYRLSEEDFFKNSKVGNIVTNLKIRGSYGKSGQITGIGAFDYLEGYNFNKGKQILEVDKSPVIGIESRGLPITSVSWVEAISKNIGIDFGFLNNKLNGSIDIFQRDREGLPVSRNDVQIPDEVGFSLPKENLESDRVFGWDAEINYAETLGEVKMNVGGSFTFSRSKMLDRYNPQYGSQYDRWKKGSENRYKNIGWGYDAIGQFTSQEQIDNHPVDIDGKNNTTLMPGDIIYRDVNGDGIISSADERPMTAKQYLPMFNYGISVGLKWKNFDMYALFNGFGKYRLGMANQIAKPFYGDGTPVEHMMDRWHREDLFDPNSAWVPGKYPSTYYKGKGTNHRTSDFWVRNVNALRLKTLEVGYSLPKRMLQGVFFKNIRFYASGLNILTWSNISSIDPESSDWSGRQYPPSRNWTLGVKCKF